MIFLLFLAIFVVLSTIYTIWCSFYWQRKGLQGPKGFPICGNLLQHLIGRKHYGEVYEALYKRYAHLPYIGIYRLFNEPAILLRSQEMIKDIMIRNFHNFEDNVLWVDPKRDPIICINPFIAKGQQWRNMRAEILPIFTPNKVKSIFPHILAICEKLDKLVAETNCAEGIEAKKLFSKYTLSVIATAAYGLDPDSFTKENAEFTKLVENIFLPNSLSLVDTTALLLSPTLGNLIQYHYAPMEVQKILSLIINQVIDKRLTESKTMNKKTSCDFIQWLIDAKQRQQEPVDATIIVGHCTTFLLEGFETSSSLMAFALYEYARNAAVQKQLLSEIDVVLARYDNKLCYEAMQEMTYLEATLYETLRLHPPMLALFKHCTKACKLPPQVANGVECDIPEGTAFIVPVKAVHSDPELYPEPLKFKPERFDAQAGKQRPSCAFLGFGEGPRICPGMRFGLAQTKAGLISLLSKYTVQLAPKTKVPLKVDPTTFLTCAENGIWIQFQARKEIS